MIVNELQWPFADLKGIISKDYCFSHRHGKLIIQKKPVFTKPWTQAQLEARRLFGERSHNGAFKKTK